MARGQPAPGRVRALRRVRHAAARSRPPTSKRWSTTWSPRTRRRARSARRIVDAFNAYSDTAAIDAAGLAPAQPYLDRIRHAPDLAALAELFAEAGIPALIGAGVTVDPKDPNRYIVSVGFDGMGLPDRDFYLVDNERNHAIQAAYKEYLAFLLGKAGYADPQATAEAVYAFEHKVAEHRVGARLAA